MQKDTVANCNRSSYQGWPLAQMKCVSGHDPFSIDRSMQRIGAEPSNSAHSDSNHPAATKREARTCKRVLARLGTRLPFNCPHFNERFERVSTSQAFPRKYQPSPSWLSHSSQLSWLTGVLSQRCHERATIGCYQTTLSGRSNPRITHKTAPNDTREQAPGWAPWSLMPGTSFGFLVPGGVVHSLFSSPLVGREALQAAHDRR